MAQNMKKLIFAAVAANLMLVCVAQSGFAQARRQREYQPARPTISPYTGLLQTNFGALPNYFSLVRPQQEQTAFNRRIQNTTRFQSISIQNIGSRSAQPLTNQTGQNAGFEQYLHFYPPIRLRDRVR